MGRRQHQVRVERERAGAATPTGGPPPRARTPRLSTGRKLLLTVLVTVVFFGLLELVLAVAGVDPVTFGEDPYVSFSGSSPLFVPRRGEGGVERMVTAADKLRLFNLQEFPRSKGRRTIRVFCLGGSTTYGHPYTHSTSFCGWLGEYLPVADPTRDWEVVNAGGISYASYRAARLAEELAELEPDLFVVLSGHNEFLERRTYADVISLPPAVRGLGALASRTRTYSALSGALGAVRGRGDGGTRQAAELEPEVTTLLDQAVGPDGFTRDDQQRERVLQHYRFNLARIVDIGRSVGAVTVLVTPAANLRSSSPFKSENRPGLGAADLARWQGLVARAREAVAGGRDAETVPDLRAALAIDDRHAHLQYFAGQVLDRLGRLPEARTAYERARDEDICPLRALGPTRGIVAEVARDRDAILVDFVDLADRWSPEGIPGDDLFLDHVHPTIDGNRRLALAILDALVDGGVVHPGPGWGEGAIAAVTARVEAAVDRRAQGLALDTLSKTLGWAGKLQEAYTLSRRALELAPDEATVQYQAGLCANLLGRLDEAEAHYLRAIELDPAADLAHGNLGVILEARGELEQAVLHQRRALELGGSRDEARHRQNLASALGKLGQRTYTQGRKPEAVALLVEADQVLPGQSETLNRLGIALLSVGQAQEAERRFRAALARTPSDAALLNRLAIAVALQDRMDEARLTFQQALALDPDLAASRDSLPNVLARRAAGKP